MTYTLATTSLYKDGDLLEDKALGLNLDVDLDDEADDAVGFFGGDADLTAALFERLDSKGGRTTSRRSTHNSLRLYLREIGSIPLLTKENEQEISQRMQDGRRKICSGVVRSLPALEYLLKIIDDVKLGKRRLDVIMNTQPEGVKSEKDVNRFIGNLKRKLNAVYKKAEINIKELRKDPEAAKDEFRAIGESLYDITFAPETIQEAALDLKRRFKRVDRAKKERERIQNLFGISPKKADSLASHKRHTEKTILDLSKKSHLKREEVLQELDKLKESSKILQKFYDSGEDYYRILKPIK